MAQYDLNDYVQVNDRIAQFHKKFPDGAIQTEILKLEDGIVIIKASAYRDREDNHPCTGMAYEREGSTFINKTSYIENCETSAVGRALAMMGFGIKKSVASREEVANAKIQQSEMEKKIPEIKVSALMTAIVNHNLESKAKEIFEKYGYEAIEDIQNKNYMAIVNELQKYIK